MATGLIDIMKRAAIDAVNNAQPCDLRYGTVVAVDPLEIKVTNVLTLPEEVLTVPQHLTDYEVEVTVTSGYGWKTEEQTNGTDGTELLRHNHDHNITINKQKMLIHNKLKVGDKVSMLKAVGGQAYYILDRVEVAST